MAKHVTVGGLSPAEIVADATIKAAFEAKIPRAGSTAGQVPVLQVDQTLAFATLDGDGEAIGPATPDARGLMRLTGDLGGTADAPTVPGLASRPTTEQVVGLIIDALVGGTGVTLVEDPVEGTVTINAAGGGGGSAANIVFAGDDPTVPRPDTADPVLWLCTDEPDNDNDAIDYWFQLGDGSGGGGGSTAGDATDAVKGLILLAGDLGGTADAPTVPGLATKVDTTDARLTNARTPTTHTHTASQISDSTAVGRSLLTAATAGAARTVLGVEVSAPVVVLAAGVTTPPTGTPSGAILVQRTS